jgi:hypothetical protein
LSIFLGDEYIKYDGLSKRINTALEEARIIIELRFDETKN